MFFSHLFMFQALNQVGKSAQNIWSVSHRQSMEGRKKDATQNGNLLQIFIYLYEKSLFWDTMSFRLQDILATVISPTMTFRLRRFAYNDVLPTTMTTTTTMALLLT